MKKLWDPVVKTADDLQQAASRLVDDGVKFFRAKLGSMKLLSSSEAGIGSDCDETHYFLVPCLGEESGYSLYRTRLLPDGVGPENELPKARVFHLPSAGTANHLLELLLRELKGERLEFVEVESALANRLEIIADEIDLQCNRVSGGLLLVGGVVAIANPLLGVGIVANSFLPGLGSKLSMHGIKQTSEWLQARKKRSVEAEAEKSAKAEVAKLKPEVRENPILMILEKTLNSPGGDVDPLMESSKLFEEAHEGRDLILGAQAVSRVYEDRSALSPLVVQWLEHLDELG